MLRSLIGLASVLFAMRALVREARGVSGARRAAGLGESRRPGPGGRGPGTIPVYRYACTGMHRNAQDTSGHRAAPFLSPLRLFPVILPSATRHREALGPAAARSRVAVTGTRRRPPRAAADDEGKGPRSGRCGRLGGKPRTRYLRAKEVDARRVGLPQRRRCRRACRVLVHCCAAKARALIAVVRARPASQEAQW